MDVLKIPIFLKALSKFRVLTNRETKNRLSRGNDRLSWQANFFLGTCLHPFRFFLKGPIRENCKNSRNSQSLESLF